MWDDPLPDLTPGDNRRMRKVFEKIGKDDSRRFGEFVCAESSRYVGCAVTDAASLVKYMQLFRVSPPAVSSVTGRAPSKKEQIDFVARVLFAETAGTDKASRALVASVIANRMGAAYFPVETAYDTVRQPRAFSCIGDRANAQWRKSAHPETLTKKERAIWNECVGLAKALVTKTFKPVDTSAVYYHDPSVVMPRNWDNVWFTPHRIDGLPSKKFFFYRVTPK